MQIRARCVNSIELMATPQKCVSYYDHIECIIKQGHLDQYIKKRRRSPNKEQREQPNPRRSRSRSKSPLRKDKDPNSKERPDHLSNEIRGVIDHILGGLTGREETSFA